MAAAAGAGGGRAGGPSAAAAGRTGSVAAGQPACYPPLCVTRTIDAPPTSPAAPPAPPAQPEHPPAAAPRGSAHCRTSDAARRSPWRNRRPHRSRGASTAAGRRRQPRAKQRLQAAASFSIPGSVRLHYQVSAHSRGLLWHGAGELLWRHDGERYEAKLEVSAPLLPSRIQQSTGSITADGLAPLRFSDKSRSEQAAHFQRDEGKVSFSNNQPRCATVARGAGSAERAVATGRADRAATPASSAPARRSPSRPPAPARPNRGCSQWRARNSSSFPAEMCATLKLTRNPRKEFDIKVELWLAPGMDYVPVRLRLTQPNGDWLDQQWSSTDRG